MKNQEWKFHQKSSHFSKKTKSSRILIKFPTAILTPVLESIKFFLMKTKRINKQDELKKNQLMQPTTIDLKIEFFETKLNHFFKKKNINKIYFKKENWKKSSIPARSGSQRSKACGGWFKNISKCFILYQTELSKISAEHSALNVYHQLTEPHVNWPPLISPKAEKKEKG